jgi:hypothetical protein
MQSYPSYIDEQTTTKIVYDAAARLIQLGGNKYFEEVCRIVTSGLFSAPTIKLIAKAKHGLPQPAPRALQQSKLEELIEGLHFYLVTLTEDGKKISLDAAYNVASYAHQLIFKLDEMKTFDNDYVCTCVNVMEHGHRLHEIDPPKAITATWARGNPRDVEIDGAIYHFNVGNATRKGTNTPRTLWKPECLICGYEHHTNEHEG